MSTGPRCGQDCGSSTVSPATVYFPQGCVRPPPSEPTSLIPCYPSTYLVTDSIPLYYYTEVIGDARKPPTILAAANFNPVALAIFGKLSVWKRTKNSLTHVVSRRRPIHSWWERKSVVRKPKQFVSHIFPSSALACLSDTKFPFSQEFAVQYHSSPTRSRVCVSP